MRITNCIYSQTLEFATHDVERLIFVSGNGILGRAKKKKERRREEWEILETI